MPNEESEVVVENNQPTTKPMSWKKMGILLSTIGAIIFVCSFGYGYFALSQVTLTLARNITELQKEFSDSQTHLANLQHSIENIGQALEKVQQRSQEAITENQATTELYSRLMAVDHQLDQLPLLWMQAPTKEETQQEAASFEKSGLSWWQIGLKHFWLVLRQLVIIRHIDSNSLPFLLPNEKLILYQNLHSQMESAIWGVLHHNTSVYQNSLTRVMEGVERYFAKDTAETKNVLQALQDLQKINVSATAQ